LSSAKIANYLICFLCNDAINDVRQTEIRTAELLLPEPGAFDVEMATESYKETNYQVVIKIQQKL
jgi:hypothetical protein